MAAGIPGFICGFHFRAAGLATPIPESGLQTAGADDGGWFWLHLNLADRRCVRWMIDTLGIPKAAAEEFAAAPARISLQRSGDHLVGHINDFRHEFDADSTEHAWQHVLQSGRRLITGRVKALQSAERLRKEIQGGAHFASPAELLAAMLANYPDTLDTAQHRLLDELEAIEDHILDDRHRGERRRLMLVRRETAILHRHMRALRRALHHAARAIGPLPDGFTPVIARLDHLDQDFDALESRARFFHDEIDAKLAAETNRQLYILSALTAAFLPPALVAGLFGMNFPWLPWIDSSWGFVFALCLCALSSAGVWLFLRSAGRN